MPSLRWQIFRSTMVTVSIASTLAVALLVIILGSITIYPPGAASITETAIQLSVKIDADGKPSVDPESWRPIFLRRYNPDLWYVVLTDRRKTTVFNAPPWAAGYLKKAQRNGIYEMDFADKAVPGGQVALVREEVEGRPVYFLVGGVVNGFPGIVSAGFLFVFPILALPLILIFALFAFFSSRAAIKKFRMAVSVLDAKLIAMDPNKSLEPIGAEGTPRELGQLVDRFNETLSYLHKAQADQRHFAAEVAHELRTPIAAVMARLQKLSPSNDSRAMLERLTQLYGFVGQLLDNERLNWADEEPVLTDLVVLARKTAGELAPLVIASKRTITLTHEVPAVEVLTDPTTVARVMHNLIANAIVHGVGQIKIHVSCDAKARIAEINVIDEGKARKTISAEKPFKRYHRGEGNGTGLGLSISLAIMKKLGGDLTADLSGPNTRFTATLPTP
jgi:two-component system, OmpR family, sensor histidine kinase TctE